MACVCRWKDTDEKEKRGGERRGGREEKGKKKRESERMGVWRRKSSRWGEEREKGREERRTLQPDIISRNMRYNCLHFYINCSNWWHLHTAGIVISDSPFSSGITTKPWFFWCLTLVFNLTGSRDILKASLGTLWGSFLINFFETGSLSVNEGGTMPCQPRVFCCYF